MISTQPTDIIDDITQLLGNLKHDVKDQTAADPTLVDIRAIRRELEILERELLEVSECEGLRGDAC